MSKDMNPSVICKINKKQKQEHLLSTPSPENGRTKVFTTQEMYT